ncbi:MAG: Na(+)-translocating NADH-quinone reductase subunit C [Zoogloeaceae bacterium]|jgi:Na+-transporting NADH:ubiquinone oxidoreductase subunit C|nr:Na(+)-translocating NADH-quinone reductase subunit C [Zoogloeaceae bacterium]
MSSNQESIVRTLVVALVVSLVASIFVAGSAVTLKPIQQKNALLDKQRSILAIAGIEGSRLSADEVRALFERRIKAEVIDLATGETTREYDPLTFDPLKVAKDQNISRALPGKEDIAFIKRREQYTTVYRLEAIDGSGELEALILPVRGYGLWSTLYGFLAIKPDLNTVVGLGFYQHGETPGLGGEVDNPAWKKLWQGKTLFDANGRPDIEVVKGGVPPGSQKAGHQVDALAGATLTSKGVNNLLTFWLGEQGFGPYLERLRRDMATPENQEEEE